MFSLGIHDLQEKQRKAFEAKLRRHKNATSKPSAQRRDFLLGSVYGKTFDEMSSAAAERRDAQVSTAKRRPETSTMLGEPDEPPGMVFHHSFRDRDEGLELGGGTISGLRYVPRACYLGGGELDGRKTASLDARREVVNGLEPRLATVSLCDVGKARGRLKQGPYSNPGYFLRIRERSKELGPPLRASQKNEPERVHETLNALTLNDPGEWVGNKEFVFPTWRHPDPKRFAGKRVALCTTPATPATHDVSGDLKWMPLNKPEPYVVDPGSSHAIKDSMVPFRARKADLELGARWNNSIHRAKRGAPMNRSIQSIASDPHFASTRSLRSAKSCHVSLRGLHTALKGAGTTLGSRSVQTL